MKSTEIIVRGYHCDAYGHVNNARYLEFYEEARWSFLQPAIEDKFFENKGLLFVVVNIQVAFKKPLLPNQIVAVSVDSAEYNNSSIVFNQSITDSQNSVYSTALVTFVLLDKSTMKPVAISDSIRSKFNSLLANQ